MGGVLSHVMFGRPHKFRHRVTRDTRAKRHERGGLEARTDDDANSSHSLNADETSTETADAKRVAGDARAPFASGVATGPRHEND